MKKRMILITLFLLSVDLITKIIVDYTFELMESKVIISNFFFLTKIYNYGASWNILSGHNIFLIIMTLIILYLLICYQRKFVINMRNTIAFSSLYSGIIGNLINRICYGYVIDFLDFKIFSYDYPVFNFADIFIFVGIVLIIWAIYKKEDESEFSSSRGKCKN